MPTTRSKTNRPSPSPLANASAVSSQDGEVRQRPSHRPREGSRSRNIEDVYDAKYAVDLATTTVDENVFLFVPNLIGYARVILAGVALYEMPTHPKACTVAYGISCLLDAVDGQAARALGQSSKFGAVLDMVTDRCTTACLLCYLASAYPSLALLFQFLISLDFASHYIHMYSSLVTGSSSHKQITEDVSWILAKYYTDKTTLFLFCFFNELFFVCLYLNAFVKTPIASTGLLSGISWPQLAGLISFPWCFGKQIISAVQFWKASKILCGIDLYERQRAREAKLLEAHAEAIAEEPLLEKQTL